MFISKMIDSLTRLIRRTVTGSSSIDFARQLREQNGPAADRKKFRSTAAPKGTKLASGYQDRTQSRTSTEQDEKALRVKALEEMVKLGQMEQATFEALRDEIVGGDVKDVHLVKGLDWKLLQRVRAGEDVLSEKVISDPGNSEVLERDSGDIDSALEQLEEKEIKPLVREEKHKKGEMAPPLSTAGRKRNRDDILRELKASRLKAEEEKAAKQPALGPKFKKLGAKQEKSRIQRDDKGREVLITRDEDGNKKKKVKRTTIEATASLSNTLLMPTKGAKPLGMEVPIPSSAEVALEDDDIFEGVGNDYDPLGAVDEDDSSDDNDNDDDGDTIDKEPSVNKSHTSDQPSNASLESTPASTTVRNYFNDDISKEDTESSKTANPLQDATILAALKKASSIAPLSTSTTSIDEEEAAKHARRKKMLESHDRDADDMDLGFGSSRFEDGEDGDDRTVKLSVWGGKDGDDGATAEGKGKRKRGGKKRKGDKDSAADVLRVMERRKMEGK